MAKEFDNITKGISAAAEKSKKVNEPELQNIDIEKIIENENNYFSVENDDKFKALCESVGKSGVLEPVIVAKNDDDTYTLISGHRRRLACIHVGKKKIPAIIKTFNSDMEKMFGLMEANVTIRDLSVADIINTINKYKRIIKETGVKVEGRLDDFIGKYIGISGRQVHSYLALERLSSSLRKLFDEHYISMNIASSYATLSEEKQEKVYIKLLENIKEQEEEGKENPKVSEKEGKQIKDEVDGKDKDDINSTGNENEGTGENDIEKTDESTPSDNDDDFKINIYEPEENNADGTGYENEGSEDESVNTDADDTTNGDSDKGVLDFSTMEEGNSKDTGGSEDDNLPFTGKDETKVSQSFAIKKCATELKRLCFTKNFDNVNEVRSELRECVNVLNETLENIEKALKV